MTGPNEQYKETLRQIWPISSLDSVPPYYVGLVSGLAWKDGLQPDKQLLYSAAVASGPQACLVIYDHWKRQQRGTYSKFELKAKEKLGGNEVGDDDNPPAKPRGEL